jgi:hypothetical protein
LFTGSTKKKKLFTGVLEDENAANGGNLALQSCVALASSTQSFFFFWEHNLNSRNEHLADEALV